MIEFEFRGLHGYRSCCGLDIYSANGQHVVVCTELPKNHGTSVTNAWPQLADKIVGDFSLDMDNVVWVEHYLPRDNSEESWDLVLLEWQNDEKCYHMTHSQHPWKPLTEDEFQDITGKAKIV